MNAKLELLQLKTELLLQHHTLLSEQEVTDLLGSEFPALNDTFEKVPNPHNIYTAMKSFADFTKQLIHKDKLEEVKHCFIFAENLLQHGSRPVRNAIENCYLFSIARLVDVAVPVRALLSGALKKEYQRQLGTSGI